MSDFDYQLRIAQDNPWWRNRAIDDRLRRLTARPFVEELMGAMQAGAKRPVLVAGPAGSGKTVLLAQLVQLLLDRGVVPTRILHLALDRPAYPTRDLAQLADRLVEASGTGGEGGYFLLLDGVQSLDKWELQIAKLARDRPQWRIVAASNVAPLFARKPKSGPLRDVERASGGIFDGFILPPITFGEFVTFQNLRGRLFDPYGKLVDTEGLNAAFMDYLNWGGFVETVLGPGLARTDLGQLASVQVLQGWAGIYGIGDMGELSRLYAHLAQLTGEVFSMEDLAGRFSIAKNTLRKYLDYLEASYLIRRIWRVDGNAQRFHRQTRFKIYLINPSHRQALFGPLTLTSGATALVAETAVISQFAHTKSLGRMHFAEWKVGKALHRVSLVEMPAPGSEKSGQPVKCIELDWSDRAVALPQKVLGDMALFMDQTDPQTPCKVLTRSIPGKRFMGEHEVGFVPVAVWCWAIGKTLADRAAGTPAP